MKRSEHARLDRLAQVTRELAFNAERYAFAGMEGVRFQTVSDLQSAPMPVYVRDEQVFQIGKKTGRTGNSKACRRFAYRNLAGAEEKKKSWSPSPLG